MGRAKSYFSAGAELASIKLAKLVFYKEFNRAGRDNKIFCVLPAMLNPGI
jgi:hypothetical protein